MRIGDWSSDVCSSDLPLARQYGGEHRHEGRAIRKEFADWQPLTVAEHRPGDDGQQDKAGHEAAEDSPATALRCQRRIKQDGLEHLAIDGQEGEPEQEPGRAFRERRAPICGTSVLPFVETRSASRRADVGTYVEIAW